MADRIGVLGAGGMGSAFAAFLTRAGRDVVLVGRGSAHVRALAAGELSVREPDGTSWTVRLPAAVQARDVPAGSLGALIVLTKTYDSSAALATIEHALAPDGVAVSVQNGLGNDAVLAEVVGSGRALVGVTTVGAALQEPGVISISASTAAGASSTDIGATALAGGSAGADAVVAALDGSGLPARHVPDVAGPIWAKLALAVMSPVSSVLRMTVGQVWATPDGRGLVERMFDETVAVAAGEGVLLDREASWAHAGAVFAGTGEHYTSMCTDVRHGRRTELSAMAGAVHDLAVAGGVPVPVHATVLAFLRAAQLADHPPSTGSSAPVT